MGFHQKISMLTKHLEVLEIRLFLVKTNGAMH